MTELTPTTLARLTSGQYPRKTRMEAYFQLGLYYAEYDQPHYKPDASLENFGQAAILGSDAARSNICRLCERLIGQTDRAADIAHYLPLAEQSMGPLITGGHAFAALEMGALCEKTGYQMLRLRDLSFERKEDGAAAALKCAAEYYTYALCMGDTSQNQAPAQAAVSLARLHLQNVIVDRTPGPHKLANAERAFDLNLRAAEMGYGPAQFYVAVHQYVGLGVPVSVSGAEKWLGEAVRTLPDLYPPRPHFRQEAAAELGLIRRELAGELPHRTTQKINPSRLAFPVAPF